MDEAKEVLSYGEKKFYEVDANRGLYIMSDKPPVVTDYFGMLEDAIDYAIQKSGKSVSTVIEEIMDLDDEGLEDYADKLLTAAEVTGKEYVLNDIKEHFFTYMMRFLDVEMHKSKRVVLVKPRR